MRSQRIPLVIVAAGVTLVVCGSPALAQEEAGPRVLSARDTLRINQVGSPELSPDGEWVVYTLGTRDMGRRRLGRRHPPVASPCRRDRQPAAHARSAERHRAGVVARRRDHRLPGRPRRGIGREDAGALPVRRRRRGVAGDRARRIRGLVLVRSRRLGAAVHGPRSAPRGGREAQERRRRRRGGRRAAPDGHISGCTIWTLPRRGGSPRATSRSGIPTGLPTRGRWRSKPAPIPPPTTPGEATCG